MDDLTLMAGVARVDITPPVGFRMPHIIRNIDASEGVESPLLATVLVLTDAQTKVVILDCDLGGMDLSLVNEIRQKIGELLDTPTSHVSVAVTHTHSSPLTERNKVEVPHLTGFNSSVVEASNAYIDNLVNQLCGIAVLADNRAQPARVASGRGQAKVAINREELNEDGRILIGRNPDGQTDHTVDVLRVDDLDGNPIAVITGYAAHPVVMGWKHGLLSPDFPGVVRRIIEQITGATCLYLTGAAGNQATLSFLQDDWGEVERTGGIIGCEAAKVFFDIETRPHDVVREVKDSLSGLALYHKEFRNEPTHQIMKAAARLVEVPLQSLPTLEKAETYLTETSDHLRKLEADQASKSVIDPARFVNDWAENVVGKIKSGLTHEILTFEIVGYRINDFVLVGMPGEPFVEIGLGVKELSKANHTMFAGYCNGTLAYWPTAEVVTHGEMTKHQAVDAAVKGYNISEPPVAETVDILVSEFGELLSDLGL